MFLFKGLRDVRGRMIDTSGMEEPQALCQSRHLCVLCKVWWEGEASSAWKGEGRTLG